MAYLYVGCTTMAHVYASGTTMALRHWTGATAAWGCLVVPRWRFAPEIAPRRRTYSSAAPRWYPASESAREGRVWVSLGGWGGRQGRVPVPHSTAAFSLGGCPRGVAGVGPGLTRR